MKRFRDDCDDIDAEIAAWDEMEMQDDEREIDEPGMESEGVVDEDDEPTEEQRAVWAAENTLWNDDLHRRDAMRERLGE